LLGSWQLKAEAESFVMKIDVYNSKRESVGSVDLNDEVFGGRVKTDLIWEAVVQENAAERRGTHATKNRAAVSGSGKKPWRQKGTGRARVGEIRNPIWRKGGTVFGPQPRSYEYQLPRKVKLGALRAALVQKVKDGAVIVVDKLEAGSDRKTKETAALFKTLGATGKTLVIDVQHEDGFARTARNLAGVRLVASSRVTARDVMDTNYVVATRAALEKLQESLG
jgi:large subunit ribosomal protein L4